MRASEIRAERVARRYRDLGLSPLPSREDRKSPAMGEYAQYRTQPLEARYFAPGGWGTPNIQLLTGCQSYGTTKIVVVDCDGDEGISAWGRICAHNDWHDPTWVVTTGSGGRHFYFRVPAGVEKVPSGMIYGLWDTFGDNGKGCWAKHREVRLLGDGALIVAPPSRHVETGRPYRFDSTNPAETPLPAEAPAWLLAMPRLVPPQVRPPNPDVKTFSGMARKAPRRPAEGPVWDRTSVLSAIPDKIALAQSWGLRTARCEPNSSGWVPCHAVGREDKRPSASLSAITGVYQDRVSGETISLFDLGVALGHFPTWQDCAAWCRAKFG